MGTPVQSEFEIRVPASIANLGPGFDTLAVAVQLYLSLRVRVLDEDQPALRFKFVDQVLQGENYIERAFQFLARQASAKLPSLEVEVRSEIPMRSGLGSSAAAVVAGIRLFDAVAGPLSPNQMLNAATALEGHPDNVAAALLGGMTSSCELPDGSATAVQFRWPDGLQFIVITPEFGLSTASARQVLPSHVARNDAVYNLQRIVLLVNSLQCENYSLLREALQDRLHQPYRQSLVPGLEDLLHLEHPDLLGVCLSGAGPSIVGFAQKNVETVAALLAKLYARTRLKYCVRILRAHQLAISPSIQLLEQAARSDH
jgi:homoserine kinase